MNGQRLSAGVFDIFNDLIGVLFIRNVVDNNGCPGRCQTFCDLLADAAVGAGYQGALPGEQSGIFIFGRIHFLVSPHPKNIRFYEPKKVIFGRSFQFQ